jgi:hypothetical protein
VAAQAGPYGIRVNCIAPETILTERNRDRIPEAQQKAMVEWHPIRRLGTPEDIAQAALYLVSNEATWVTGCGAQKPRRSLYPSEYSPLGGCSRAAFFHMIWGLRTAVPTVKCSSYGF